MNEEALHKNLELWAYFYPKEAVMLPYVDGEGYAIENGFLHGPKGKYPTNNPEEWFKSLGLKDEKVVVVYGIGSGEMCKVLLKWLHEDKNRKLFFFEEDPNVLLKFFETAGASTLLSDPQVEIHLLHELTETDPALDKFYWSAALMPVAIGIHPAYAEWYPARAEEFEHKVRYTLEIKNALLEEYISLGISFFRNFYFNLLELPTAYMGNKLFGKFKKTPAIICGAGPSLDKQLDQIKNLKNKALIVAGGSSLNALSHANIKPHFSAALDPNAEQAVRLKTNKAQQIPFFYRNRVFNEALKLIEGPRLYVTGSGGYDISDYFEQELGIKNEFIDEGHNVINFLCEITTRLGCNPIIFVGVDLAYTDKKAYAEGVVEDNVPPGGSLTYVNSVGESLLTEWKWLGEAKWIEEFAKEHDETTFINCTEGGFGIAGIEEMPLEEAVNKYLKKDFDLVPKFSSAIEKAKKKGITLPKIIKLIKKLQKSLMKCFKSLEAIEKDALYRIEHDPLAPASPHVSMIELSLIEEPGYGYVLDIFNHVFASIQSSSLRRLRLQQDKITPAEFEKEKLLKQNERIDFLKNVVQVNLQIIRLALDEADSRR